MAQQQQPVVPSYGYSRKQDLDVSTVNTLDIEQKIFISNKRSMKNCLREVTNFTKDS